MSKGSEQAARIRADLGKGMHDFYRCWKCGSILTREEELEFYAHANELGDGDESETMFCDCGSMKIQPCVPKYDPQTGGEWRKRNVLRYAVKMILARGIIPWLEKRFPRGVPLAEWLLESELLSRYDRVAWMIVKPVVRKSVARRHRNG